MKLERTELMMFILTKISGMPAAPESDVIVNVELLKDGTDEIRPQIEGLRHGKRAYRLLLELYDHRAVEESCLRGERLGKCSKPEPLSTSAYLQ